MKYLLCLLLALSLTSHARAQFGIEQTLPAHGSVSVPLTDTVAFAFTAGQSVDVGTDWNTAFVHEPRLDLLVTRVALCINLSGPCAGGDDVPRFVRFTAAHESETDYTWFVNGVRSSSGRAMQAPFVLRYTTAATIGARTVRGSVRTAAAKRGSLSTTTRATLREVAALLAHHGQGRPVYAMSRDAAPTYTHTAPAATSEATASEAADGHTRILLLDAFGTNEALWEVRAGAAIEDHSGAFTAEYVRSGTYWPIAVHYTDPTNEEIAALGFYDADSDGVIDSLVIGETDPADIVFDLYPFELATARGHLDRASEAAAAVAPDQRLVLLRAGSGARPSGEAYVWTYTYHSPSLDLVTAVTVDPLTVTSETAAADARTAGMRTIDPAAFADSDAALAAVAESGGAAFWEPYMLRNLSTLMEGGNLYWRSGVESDQHVWRIRVLAFTGNRVETYETYVDLSSGTIVSNELADLLPDAAVVAGPSYPNPFASSVQLPVTLSRPEHVRLSVYNLLGQQVAVPHDGTLMPGGHTLSWTPSADLPAGVYVYRLEAGDVVQTGQFVRAGR